MAIDQGDEGQGLRYVGVTLLLAVSTPFDLIARLILALAGKATLTARVA
jgi:hypothetical protein